MAPLAEVEVDPNEEDPIETLQENMEIVQSQPQQQPQKSEKSSSTDVEKKKKRKEKKEKQGSCEQPSDEAATGTSTSVLANPEKAKHNAVCPWEDE